MRKIEYVVSNERLITPSGLSLVGQVLGKSNLIKKSKPSVTLTAGFVLSSESLKRFEFCGIRILLSQIAAWNHSVSRTAARPISFFGLLAAHSEIS